MWKISYTVRKMFTNNSSITHKCFNRMRRQPAAAVRKGLWKVPVKKRNVRLDAIPDTAVYNTVIKGKPQRIDSRIIAVWKIRGHETEKRYARIPASAMNRISSS